MIYWVNRILPQICTTSPYAYADAVQICGNMKRLVYAWEDIHITVIIQWHILKYFKPTSVQCWPALLVMNSDPKMCNITICFKLLLFKFLFSKHSDLAIKTIFQFKVPDPALDLIKEPNLAFFFSYRIRITSISKFL